MAAATDSYAQERQSPQSQDTPALRLSPFQQRVLSVPEEFDLFLGGGRGGAKSYALAILALRHVEQYTTKARVLYLRQTHKGCADFSALCLDLFTSVYGKAMRWNSQEGVFRFPNGGLLEINQIESQADYGKFTGRSFTLCLCDEIGQYATPDLLDKLRSNLRGPEGIPIRVVLASNPGDVGHQWIARRYVFQSASWTVFVEQASGRPFVSCPSTYRDNPFIDQASYRRQIEASCSSDQELLKAWLDGDWAVARGAYFASCLDENRNATATWPSIPTGWQTYLAHDFGVSAPSVTYIIAKSPGATGPDGRYYSRNSLILVDELATCEPDRLNTGLGWLVPKLAEAIREMCAHWKVKPQGVADDACWAAQGHSRGSIADEFKLAGVYFQPAKKADRITGWQTMRRLLADAGKPDVPGLYIARHCEYFWATVPYLARDPKRVEDLDSRSADHAADAVRYGVNKDVRTIETREFNGASASNIVAVRIQPKPIKVYAWERNRY
jgi:hypothetical protein